MPQNAPAQYILKIRCPAASGIVAAISGCLAQNGCYISEMAQYDDETTGYFFTRIVFRFNDASGDIDSLKASFAEVEQQFAMQATFYDCSAPMKVMILVSKFDHCFLNLLYRHHKGELDFQITAVVSLGMETVVVTAST